MKELGIAAALACVIASGGLCRQDPVVCGTYPAKRDEQLGLHWRAEALRSSRVRRLGVAPAQTPAGVQDNGNLVVMEDSDGVVVRGKDFDLAAKTLTFQPVSASAASYRFQVSGNTYDSAAAASGALLSGLGDDDSQTAALPFAFPFFGSTYRQIFVNSDGNLTFTAAESASFERSIGRLMSGPPRIAPLFSDLDPSKSTQGVSVLAEPARVVVSWVRVPEYSDTAIPGPLETFQVRLYPDGKIEFAFSTLVSSGAVVGIGPGSLAAAISLVSFSTDPSAEYSATVAERFSSISELDTVRAAQRFYQTHEDAYDYLIFYNNESIPAAPGAVAWETNVRNRGAGFGAPVFDEGRIYGSASRLQGVINMGPLVNYPADPNGHVALRGPTQDTPLTVLAHEAGHRFLAYASVPDPEDRSSPAMLGYQNSHWHFAFNSDASLLEGNRIQDNGPSGTTRFLTAENTLAYSAFDQYLMGFRGPEEVEGQHRNGLFFVTGVPASYKLRHPQSGVGFNGDRRDVTVEQIISVMGRRTPDSTVAQRRFRFAFVLVVPQGTQPAPDELAKLETFRSGFEAFFQQASSNRASADASLRRALKLSVFPSAGVPERGSGNATLSVERALPTPLTVSLQAQSGFISMPASVMIPAGATSASFEISAVRSGVDELTAAPADTAFETVFARIQVAPASSLRLVSVSGAGQQANGSAALPNPIVVRLTDANDLPYPGIRIQAAPSSGGSVDPAVASTDARGQASFRWTTGTAAGANLIFRLESGAPNVSLVVNAAERPGGAAAAVNAASFAPSITPGALATLYGSGLTGGITAQAPFPWPETLAGVRLTMNGAAAQLLFISDRQINFLVPPDVPVGSADLTVSIPAGTTTALKVNMASLAPGIFFDPATGFGAVLRAGTAEVTSSRPAPRGGYIEIYCTGLGPLRVSTDSTPPQTIRTPQVIVGGVQAPVVYSGLASGYLGLYQVNAQIPPGVAPGQQTLSIVLDGIRSNEVKIGVE